MKIDTNYEVNSYVANGVLTDFSFDFQVLKTTDIVVNVKDTDENVEEKTLGTDYTATINSNGTGQISFAVAPANDYIVYIGRYIAETQENEFKTSSGFQAEIVENSFNKLTLITQQLSESEQRALKVSQFADSNVDGTIQEAVANKGLMWKDDGNGNIAIYTTEQNPDTVYNDIVNNANVVAVASNINNINAVASNSTNINSVAGNSTNINTVANNITNVNSVANNILNINSVASNSTNINSVATDLSNINVVATNIADVNSVSANILNVNSVASNSTNINSVAGDLTNIDSVAGDLANIDNVVNNLSDISTVVTNISDINSVASDLTNIDNVAGDLTNIDNVASDLTNINTVATNIANVNTNATNIADINTNATNISNINTVAANIADIQDKANKDLDNITATAISNLANDFTKIDGSNATFSNLNNTAKQNITNTVFGNIQTADNSEVGYTVFYTAQSMSSFTLPSGGSYFVSTISFNTTSPYDFRSALSKNGIFAGGTTFTSGIGNLYVIGFAIKIQ